MITYHARYPCGPLLKQHAAVVHYSGGRREQQMQKLCLDMVKQRPTHSKELLPYSASHPNNRNRRTIRCFGSVNRLSVPMLAATTWYPAP